MDGSEIFSMYKIGCHVKILGVGFSIGFSACKPSSKVNVMSTQYLTNHAMMTLGLSACNHCQIMSYRKEDIIFIFLSQSG